jgi:hypothetical protein
MRICVIELYIRYFDLGALHKLHQGKMMCYGRNESYSTLAFFWQ